MFRINALPRQSFSHLFGLDEASLRAENVLRMAVDESLGFPCRVSLKDLSAGDTVLLLNYEHMALPTPFRSRHAIFVSETEPQAFPDIGEVPDVIARRQISLRAFTPDGMMTAAELSDGCNTATPLTRMMRNPDIGFVDLHYASRGCFAARAVRA